MERARSAACSLLVALLVAGTALAEEKGATTWLGLTETDIRGKLGPPLSFSEKDGGRVLTYEGAFQWLVEPGELDVTSGSTRGGKRTTKIKGVEISANDGSEPYLPPAGDPRRPGDSAAPRMWVPADPVAQTEKLRIWLDGRGQVWKVRMGKKTIAERAPQGPAGR